MWIVLVLRKWWLLSRSHPSNPSRRETAVVAWGPIWAPMMAPMVPHPRIPIIVDTIKSSRPLFAGLSSLETAQLFGAVPAQSPVVRLGRSGQKHFSNSPCQRKRPFVSGQISSWQGNLPHR
jgi:hypothetical protein